MDEARTTPQGKPKKGRGLLMILGLVLATSAGAGGGVWYWQQQQAPAGKQAAKHIEPVAEKPAFYLPLEPVTVNMTGDYIYLQVGVSLRADSQELLDKLKPRQAEMLDALIRRAGELPADKLNTEAARTQLRAAVLADVHRIGGAEADGVDQVFLTRYVLQ